MVLLRSASPLAVLVAGGVAKERPNPLEVLTARGVANERIDPRRCWRARGVAKERMDSARSVERLWCYYSASPQSRC